MQNVYLQCTMENIREVLRDMSTFSFQSSKTLTCGEGGILLTNNKKLYLACKMKSNLGYYINNHAYKKNRFNLQKANFKRHEITWI